MKNLYKLIWWDEMEQSYTESILEAEGVEFIIQCVGEESIFSLEEL